MTLFSIEVQGKQWFALAAQDRTTASYPETIVASLTALLRQATSTSELLHALRSLLSELYKPSSLFLSFEETTLEDSTAADRPLLHAILQEARFSTAFLSWHPPSDPRDGHAIFAPLLLEDQSQGFLCLIASEDHPWDEQETALLQTLASFASLSLQFSQTLRKAQEDREVLHLNLVGVAPSMQALKGQLLRVAQTEAPTLVIGEEGVGKSRIARSIHQASPRRYQPLTVLNASTFPKELFEIALCGSVENKDASTRHRPGKIEMAHKGSFLIEEIGEIPLGIQPTLVALLQTGEITPLGSPLPRAYDIRLLATSTLSLEELLAQEKIIPALANLFLPQSLVVPSLHLRQEDIPQLFRAFLSRLGEEEGLPTAVVSEDALPLLKTHPWSLNIRELRKIVSRCFYDLDPDYPVVTAELLQKILQEPDLAPPHNRLQEAVFHLERQMIQEALMSSNDDPAEAARALGIHRIVFRRKMRQLGIG